MDAKVAMLSLVSLRERRRVLAALAATAVIVGAATASIAASPPTVKGCGGADSEAQVVPTASLAQVRYRCMELRKGQRVLVGEAGEPGRTTVLLVHGLGNNAHLDWGRIMPALAARHRVVTLDLPGFGGSPRTSRSYSFAELGDTLAEVLNSTAPGERVHVVGHSLGAALSLYFAHAYPMQVDRLVLVDAAGILLKSVFAQHIVSAQPPTVGVAPLDPLLRGLVDRVNSFRRNLFSKLDDGFDVSRWLAQNPDIRHALLGRFAQVEAAHALIEHDFTVAIRETTAPTTVIWGANDRVAPLRTGTLLAGRMPNARLKVMEGVGHAPMLESPDDFVSLLFEALTVHVPQRQVERADGPSRGTVVCENRTHVYYSGVFDTITLDRCDSVRIAGARIESLVVRASSLTIENSSIHSSNVALTAESSEVTATNVTIQGRVGIRASFSRLDLAGVSVMATERGIELPGPGRLLFSVSDLSAPDFNGDAHFQWPASQFNRPGN